MEKADRIAYLDHLRIFATFAVIILHVSGISWESADVNGFEWQVYNIFNSAVRWCVPVFVMISGSLFLGREVPVKTIYSKYILRLAVAFVVWSVIYGLYSGALFTDKVSSLIHGHYHMWFVLMIAGLYMCLPIIKPIAQNKNRSGYFLVLALVFGFIIPQAVTLANDFGGNLITTVANALEDDLSAMQLHMILGYTSYFILGYSLSKTELSKKQRTVIYLLGLAGFISTVLLTSAIALKTQTASEHYYGYFNVNVLLEAAAVFVWFKYRRYDKVKHPVLIQKLSKYSFGAYLVHILIISLLTVQLGLNTASLHPVLIVLCLSVAVFAASYAVSAVLNHIPIVKKYMV